MSVHMGMLDSQLGIFVKDNWNQMTHAKIQVMDSLEDGVTKENSFSFLSCSSEG